MISRKLRILYVDETTGFGGGMVGLRNLIAGLDQVKYVPAVIVRADNTAMRAYLRENLPRGVRAFPVRRRDFLWLPSVEEGVARVLCGVLGPRGRRFAGRARWAAGFLLDALPAALEIAAIARKWKADAIHTNEHLTTNVAGIVAARLAGIPCFCHNRMVSFPAGLARRLVPLVAHCFAMSEFIKKDMVARGVPAGMISVVYDGLDLRKVFVGDAREPARREVGFGVERCIVGIFGRIVEWKGHEFFLRAFALASREVPNLCGLVVGDTSSPNGPLMKGLRRLLVQLGISDQVLMMGYRTDVSRLMSATDIVVVPSVEPEPFGLVNLEAMAVSRPVIATRLGGVPEVVKDGENGLLISVGDVEAFAQAIVRLSRDPAYAEQLGRQGRRIVEQRFTHELLAQGVSQEYDRVLRVSERSRA